MNATQPTLVFLLAPFGLGVIAFLATYSTMPRLIGALSKAGIMAPDLHKPRSKVVPTMGGIGVFVGFATAMTYSALLGLDYRLLFAIFLSGTLALLVGLIDDLFEFGKVALVIATFLISMPIVAFQAGSTLVYLTPIGPADFGWTFWLLVPFAFAFTMNGVNIYAGFNGLEAGLGTISALSLGVCALIYGSIESAAALFALGGGLLAFLKWNWYPARIFPGGTGTFLIGAVLASSIIAGTIKITGIIVLLPYFINFLLRAMDRFEWSVGTTLPNGKITSRKLNALWAVFMHHHRRNEKYVVARCIALQIAFAATAIAFAYVHVNFIRP